MIFAFSDSGFGIDGLFGLFIIQPIFAVIISGLTILFCLLIGLPIRLNKKVNYWWTKNFYISLIGLFIGFSFLIIATFPNFTETVSTEIDGYKTLKQIPDLVLTSTGWFVMVFSILHIFPPKIVTQKIENLFSNH